MQDRREVGIAKHHAGFHGRIQRESSRLAAEPAGGDHRVDRVSAVPQDLSPNLRSEVMWGRYDPPRHRGVMNSIAPGWISKSAGRKPTSSPSRSMRTGSGDVTVIRLPYMSSIFGLPLSRCLPFKKSLIPRMVSILPASLITITSNTPSVGDADGAICIPPPKK